MPQRASPTWKVASSVRDSWVWVAVVHRCSLRSGFVALGGRSHPGVAADAIHQPLAVELDVVFLDPGGLAPGHILLAGKGGQGDDRQVAVSGAMP